jgi:hypothetical protein
MKGPSLSQVRDGNETLDKTLKAQPQRKTRRREPALTSPTRPFAMQVAACPMGDGEEVGSAFRDR